MDILAHFVMGFGFVYLISWLFEFVGGGGNELR